jgi:HK97 family phage major capsid protein
MNSKEIRSSINSLLMEQQKIATLGFTPESRTKFDKMQADVEALEADLQRVEAIEQRITASAHFERSPRPDVGDGQNITHSAEERRVKVREAVRSYARYGFAGLNTEQRDLLTSSDTTGGALIPQEFAGVLVEAMKFFGPTAAKVKQKVTRNNGAPMKISLGNDTGNGLALLGTEGTSSPAETDPDFQSKNLSVDTVTGGLVKVSFQEIEDSSFDLDDWLRTAFGKRYGRGLETAVTLGKDMHGNTLPNQAAGGLVGTAATGTTTGAIANGIAWDDLVNTLAALDPAYLSNAAWVMNSTTRNFLLGLKDGFGRPFFTPDPTNDMPFKTLMGYPIVLNQAMAGPTAGTFTANSVPILFGSLEDAYMLRTDGQPTLLRLNERYADTLEVGFYLYSRIGGISLNAGINPLTSLKIAAS